MKKIVLFILLCVVFCYSQTVKELWEEYRNSILKDPSLVAYYDFNGNKGDILTNRASTGEVLNGIIHNGEWVEGRFEGKYGIRFSGKTYIEIPPHPVLFPFGKECGEGEITIEVWLKPAGNAEAGIVDKYSEGWGRNAPYAIWISSKRLMGFFGGDGVSGQGIKDTVDVSIDTWHHIVFTVSSEKITLYKNGMKVAEADRSHIPVDNNKPLLIGCMKPGLYPFVGIIDEVAIYNISLPEKEIKKHYRAGKTLIFFYSLKTVGYK